jgi:ribonuclease M5
VIREVIVVEGKKDVAAVKKAVTAECLVTEGFSLSGRVLAQIEAAYRRVGIIILTDPDSAGERIRKALEERFPRARHAFIPREEASTADDIGVERAQPAAIRAALAKARYQEWQPEETFTGDDMHRYGLVGTAQAADRRAAAGAALGIGYANAKTFLRRLNNYGVTREEFTAAMAALEADNG